MIAYEELAAALERWRIRNGLPGTPPLFAEGAPRAYVAPAAVAAPAPAPAFAPPPAPVAPPPAPYVARTTPPVAPPPPSTATLDDDLGDLGDADVLDEGQLDPDGPDFAMSFGGGRSPTGAPSDDDRESTMIGGPEPGGSPWPEAQSFSSGEATAAAAYGWGQTAGRPAATVADDEDEGEGTLDGGGKPPAR